jgi:hypothetical protein
MTITELEQVGLVEVLDWYDFLMANKEAEAEWHDRNQPK